MRLLATLLAIGFACAPFAAAQATRGVTAPTTGSAFVGLIPVEGWAQGSLVASADVVALHGYRVDVPAGLRLWTLELDADADLDLAVKYGSPIATYRDRASGGDCDRLDVGTDNPTVVVVAWPWAGPWYVAVLNPLEPGVWGTYRLTSIPLEGAPLEIDVEGVYRGRASGTLLVLRRDGERVVGTLGTRERAFAVDAMPLGTGAYGLILGDAGRLGFVAFLTPTGIALVLFDVDADGRAIEGSAWGAAFEREAEAPAPAVRDDAP